jgi:hypothetical protein
MRKPALIFAALVLAMFLLPLLAGAATAEQASPDPLFTPLAAGFAGLVTAGLVLGRRRATGSLG